MFYSISLVWRRWCLIIGLQIGAKIKDGTAEMVKLLDEAYGSIDITSAPYLVNSKRKEHFRTLVENTPEFNRRIPAIYRYCEELLNAGEVERAIVELQTAINELSKIAGTEDALMRFNKVLAIAYLRLGEVNNCVAGRSHSSCIVPIDSGGVHTLTTGSENAIRVLMQILEKRPDDEESIWLLNLAHMTLGTYPDGVPERWRISEGFFASEYEVKRFQDVSRSAGIKDASLAGGVAVADFNNDGLLDIITSSWGVEDPLEVLREPWATGLSRTAVRAWDWTVLRAD